MKKRILSIVVLALGLTAQAEQRPNILFIFLDDFGWRDTGYMGSDFYETPNIDRLAKGGMVFTDAYSCAANCAPARACLLSGQYTPRHRIFNVGTTPRGSAKHRRLEHIAGTKTLRPNIVTWAEALQQSGYRTGMFGKWHLGTSPTEQGFDVEVDHTKLPGFRGHFGPDGQYLADVLSDRTIKFIEGSQGKPWCAYLSHFAVHTPIQAKRKIEAKYKAKRPGKLHQHPTMAAMIESVDDGVGKIIAKLGQLGQRDNTVIFFFSDNGGFGPATDMAPLWGYKGNYYEGGIRVPFFVNWPDVVKPGQSTTEPIIGVDIYPTFLDLAKAKRPDQPMDGRSLLAFIRGEAKRVGPRPLFWHFPAYLQAYKVIGEQRDPLFRTRPCSAVRLGDWKLHEYFEDGALELYNLKDDISERKNLAKAYPAKARELHKLLVDWRKKINAPVPTKPNPEFDAAAESAAARKILAQRGK